MFEVIGFIDWLFLNGKCFYLNLLFILSVSSTIFISVVLASLVSLVLLVQRCVCIVFHCLGGFSRLRHFGALIIAFTGLLTRSIDALVIADEFTDQERFRIWNWLVPFWCLQIGLILPFGIGAGRLRVQGIVVESSRVAWAELVRPIWRLLLG